MIKIFLSLLALLFTAPNVLAGTTIESPPNNFGPGWMMTGFNLDWGWIIFWHFALGLSFIALATLVVKIIWQGGNKMNNRKK